MELATAFIWTLRILLPVILFCIYFKLQSKDENEGKGRHDSQRSSGPSYTRDEMVRVRNAAKGGDKPAALETMTLAEQKDYPKLFAEGGRGRQRNDGGKRERGDGRGRDAGRRSRKEDNRETDAPVEQDVTDAVEAVPEVPEFEPVQEKMHMESLLNYVAFNHREQRRVFLPDTAGGPPPPPPPPRQPVEKVEEEAALKANSEAQNVLRGAMKVGRAEVVGVLHDKLTEQHVEISESTFTLMIEACILARDLKQASDFLLKMENASYNPDSNLLDKVMNLYSEQKTQKAKDAQNAAQTPVDGFSMLFPPMEEIPEGVRAKLSSQAVEFVPSFTESYETTKLSSKADAFIPVGPPITTEASEQQSPEASAEDAEKEGGSGAEKTSLRTALKATSKPFAPQFDLSFEPQFDPYMYEYAWHMGGEMGEADNNESGKQNGSSKKGKGKGKQEKEGASKGKDKGKGKGKASSKDDDIASAKTKAKAKPKPKAKEKETSSEGAQKKTDEKESSAAQPKWKVKEAA